MANPSFSSDIRSDNVTNIVTRAGNGAKLKFYSGTRPANLGALSGNTLLATLTQGGSNPIGTVSGAVLTLATTGWTQTNSSHVNGTATFVDITTSGDVLKGRVEIGGGAGQFSISATVQNGVDISINAGTTITAGNA